MTDLRPEPRRAKRVERNHLPDAMSWGQEAPAPTGRHAQPAGRQPQPPARPGPSTGRHAQPVGRTGQPPGRSSQTFPPAGRTAQPLRPAAVTGRGPAPRPFPARPTAARPAPDQTTTRSQPAANPFAGHRPARPGLDLAGREDRTTTITPAIATANRHDRHHGDTDDNGDNFGEAPARRPQRTPRTRRPPARATALAAHPWHLTLLAGLAFALHIALARTGGYSWHFFADGASLLFGQHPPGMVPPGGLHLYANYPQLQFGPVALLLAAAVRPFADGGWMVASGLMTMSGLFVLHLLDNVVYAVRPDLRTAAKPLRLTMLIGGGSFLFSWELLAVHFGHLDDVLALVFITGALAAAVSRRPVVAGLCVGLAADSKPWALVCVALLLMFSRSGRLIALGVAALAVVVAWLPFVLADPHTLSATQFTIPNVPASALHALGVNDPTTPSWDRMAQLALGCGLGVLAVIRRRWAAVIALGIGARLLLDPSVYTYYTAGFALGLLLWDLAGWRKPMPLLSLLSFGSITMAVFLVHDPRVLGELRLWTVLACAAIMLIAPSAPGSLRQPVPRDEELPGPETREHRPVFDRGRAA